MNFIHYDNLIFSKLSEIETVLITAEKGTWVESISICNLSDNVSGIRLNLKIIKALEVSSLKEAFRVRHLLIDKNQSKDLIVYLGNKIFLNNGDSLIIFSEGYKELFDCTVDFYELNET
jgi:hypothetical protein